MVFPARRRSCLQALSVKPGHIRFENHGVRFIPDHEFLPKNQTLDFVPGDIFIPELKTMSSIPEDKYWCPVRALKWYLKRTEAIKSSSRLIVLPSTPLEWLLRILFLAGWLRSSHYMHMEESGHMRFEARLRQGRYLRV